MRFYGKSPCYGIIRGKNLRQRFDELFVLQIAGHLDQEIEGYGIVNVFQQLFYRDYRWPSYVPEGLSRLVANAIIWIG